MSTELLLKIAAGLNAFAPEKEKVAIFAKRKPDGGYRPIQSFGIKHRARQHLVAAGVRPFLTIREDQYAVQNGGRTAAIRRVIAEIEGGAAWFVERDIANCFASFGLNDGNSAVEALTEWLPLPERVTRHCITAVDYSYDCHISYETCSTISLIIDSRKGLPQGSASSGLLAEARIAEILDSGSRTGALKGVSVTGYADNLGLLARHRKHLMASMKTLERTFVRCSSGSWRLKPASRPRRVDHGFNFLGYHIRRVGTKVKVTASEGNREEFARRCREKLKVALKQPEAQMRDLERYANSWAAAFAEDREIRRVATRMLVDLAWDLDPNLLPRMRTLVR